MRAILRNNGAGFPHAAVRVPGFSSVLDTKSTVSVVTVDSVDGAVAKVANGCATNVDTGNVTDADVVDGGSTNVVFSANGEVDDIVVGITVFITNTCDGITVDDANNDDEVCGL